MHRLVVALIVLPGVAIACVSEKGVPMPNGISWEYTDRPGRIRATVESIDEADMRAAAESIRTHNMGGDSWRVEFVCAGDPDTSIAHAMWANSRVGEAQVHLEEGDHDFWLVDGATDGSC